ncbi:MAG: sirohydrochlorin chelatase [Burkholderiales bacterium]
MSQGTSAGRAGLILFAHGSKDPQWATPFLTIQERIRRQRADLAVWVAYLEMMQPSLPEAVDSLVAAGRQRIAIAPLFMAEGAHLRRDLAELVAQARARHADVKFKLLPPIGEVEAVIEAMSTWIAANA